MATKSVRRAALGGVIGPVAFVGSWSVLGAMHRRLFTAARSDPRSRRGARVDAGRDDRRLRRVLHGHGALRVGAARHVAGTGVDHRRGHRCRDPGVAAFPLHHSATVDSVHGVFAGIGYATLAATALLSGARARRARPPRSGLLRVRNRSRRARPRSR